MALALAAAGADIAALSRTRFELESLGRIAIPIVCDVTIAESCTEAVEQSVRTAGRLDILVNSAGINVRKPDLELQLEEFELVVLATLRGCVHRR